uniref:Solute carrier family 10 member 6 n=1 Tax=Erpetoichthys calabaricus TaxID=27687 RepID=A0A8C4SNM4_ERPCA
MLNCINSSDCVGNTTDGEEETFPGFNDPLNFAFTCVLSIMLALVVFSLGCTVEVQKLWFHIRRPWGIGLGIVCQFGLMPFIGYILSIAFALNPVHAVAVLIMGCCPGGIISNVITYWIDGDMDLSIAMTTCSTILAMGMMPLCLYIYSSSWVQSGNIKIPYTNIGITLVSLIVPVSAGIFVNYRWPKHAKKILKVGSILGWLIIVIVTVISVVLFKGSWAVDTSVLIIGVIYPIVGYVSGFALAFLLRQPWKRCRTICLETGAQNIQVCATVLQTSFTPKQLVLMFSFPLIYCGFQFLHGVIFLYWGAKMAVRPTITRPEMNGVQQDQVWAHRGSTRARGSQ